jgi:hypothetical protein
MDLAVRNRAVRCLGGALCVSVTLAACSGDDSNAGGPEAGNDVSTPFDAAQDHGNEADSSQTMDAADARVDADAPATDARVDADASADVVSDAPHCASVNEACADAGGDAHPWCVLDWSTARQPSTWCSKFPNHHVIVAPHCDGFDLVVIAGVDSDTVDYYDPQTGTLVAIEAHGEVFPLQCLAGQTPDVPLTDCSDGGVLPYTVCLSDGSVGAIGN